ncbi:hypothetical protein B0H14DRAFT_1451450 [Mycena olivaceomarginata]|nr:hypothetical protein B0H14DRAFT_1451450 [Mycena olivaceomarginata]
MSGPCPTSNGLCFSVSARGRGRGHRAEITFPALDRNARLQPPGAFQPVRPLEAENIIYRLACAYPVARVRTACNERRRVGRGAQRHDLGPRTAPLPLLSLSICVPEPHNPAPLPPGLDPRPEPARIRRGTVCGARRTFCKDDRECHEHAWKRKSEGEWQTAYPRPLRGRERQRHARRGALYPARRSGGGAGGRARARSRRRKLRRHLAVLSSVVGCGCGPLDGFGESRGLVVVENIYVAITSRRSIAQLHHQLEREGAALACSTPPLRSAMSTSAPPNHRSEVP